ncbi:MAG TPA: MFS transporter [Ktedonobacteraceae bacterium]|nr:MFS transporter [Ktedonobacteraceae bacterium]
MYSVQDKQDKQENVSGWSNEVKIPRLTFRGQLALNVLWFALNAQSAALLPIVIPAQIVLFITSKQVGSIQQVLFLSWLMIGASVISLFLPPLVGMLSDRTPGIFGRRRPYIVIGGLLVIISTPLLVDAGSLAIFVAGLALLLLGKNILGPAYQSLMPDRVPGEQRGETAGYVGGMTILGNVVGLGLAAFLLGSVNQHSFSMNTIRANAGIYYAVTAFLVLVCIVVTVFGVRENRWLKHVQVVRQKRGLFELAVKLIREWVLPWRSYNFTMVFLTRASLMLGLALFMAYIEYFFANVQHIANFIQVTGIVAILALGGAVVSGLVFGVVSDRVKRRAPVVSAATVCMALASLTFVIFPNNLMTLLWPLGVVFGLGYGAYTSVGWALSIDVLPSLEKAGKDLGVWNASTTLPAIMAPLLGSVIINAVAGTGNILLGYQLVFGAAAMFFVLAAIGMLFVKK